MIFFPICYTQKEIELSSKNKSFLILNSDSGSDPEGKLKSELTLFLFLRKSF